MSQDPYLLLRENAAKRPKRTKAELLTELAEADEVYLNLGSERDMAEAYYKALEQHLHVHGCTLDTALIADDPELPDPVR